MYKKFDLSSLQTVTYGTEVMPESTLKRFHALYPNIKLQQTYGLSEVGILRSKSKSSDSLWVKVGGEGFETRIVDGLLEIKAKSAMLGYLNAPVPLRRMSGSRPVMRWKWTGSTSRSWAESPSSSTWAAKRSIRPKLKAFCN